MSVQLLAADGRTYVGAMNAVFADTGILEELKAGGPSCSWMMKTARTRGSRLCGGEGEPEAINFMVKHARGVCAWR